MERKKVLVVEDEGIVAKDIAQSLENLNYDVPVLVGSGKEAIHAADEVQPDLIIMDIKLKGDMDGIQTAEVIRNRYAVPIVYLTAYADRTTLERAKVTGPFGYIIKPFDERELQVTIEMALYKYEMENALEESEEKFRSMSEQALMGIAIVQDDVMKYANRTFCDILGYPEKELLEHNVEELKKVIHQDDRSFVLEQGRKKQQGEKGAVEHYSYRMINREGAIRWVDHYSKTITYQGRFADFINIVDITDRKEAEEALRKSEERYRSLVENVNDVIFELDLKGVIKYMSPAIERISDYKAKEVIGREYAQFIYPEDLPVAQTSFLDTLNGKAGYYEYRVLDKNESIRWIRTSSRAVMENGKQVGVAGVLTDITDSKKMQTVLQERARHEECIAFCSQILLEAKDQNFALESVVKELLSAIEVSLVQILENFEDPRDGTCMRLICETAAEGIRTRTDNPTFKHLPCDKLGEHFLDSMIVGEAYGGSMSELPKEQMDILGIQGLRSFLIIPIRIGDQLWGNLITADCLNERTWKQAEINLLQTIASIIGNAVNRNKAEEEIRRTQKFLDSIVENIPDMLFVKDAEKLRFVRFNKAGEELLGYPREAILGKGDHDFFPKNEADFFNMKDREVLEGRKLVDIPEEPIKTRDKGLRILHTKKIPILNENGDPQYLLGISEDVTERKRAEEALKNAYKAREELEQIINQSEAIIFLWRNEEHWPVEFVSDNIRLYGYSPQDWYSGKVKYADIIYPDDLSRVADEVKRYSEEGRTEFTQEYRVITRKGNVRWVDDRTLVRRDTSGNITHYQGLILDITERKKALEALKESEEKLRAVVETANQAIISANRKGGIIAWNQAAERMLGFTKEEVIGKSPHILVPERLRERFSGGLERAMAKGQLANPNRTIESVGKRKDGTEFPVEISFTQWESGGEVFFTTIMTDITERKLAEEREKNYVMDLAFLSESAMEFVGFSPERNIYEHIGEGLKKIVGEAFVIVNSFEANTQEFMTRAIYGAPKGVEASLKLIGKNIVGTTFPVTEEARVGLTSGKLEKVERGIYELAGGNIPNGVCNAIEKLLGLGAVYAMGFAKKDEIFGSACILLPKTVQLKNKNIIETFITQASVALQRQIAQRALGESEERYRTLTDEALVGIYIIGSERFLFVNPAMEKITGYSKDELLQIDPFSIVLPDDTKAVMERRKNRSPEQPDQYPMKIRSKDGKIATLEVRIRPMVYRGETVYLGNCIDVTELVRQREQIEQAKKEWEETFDSISDLVMIVDSKGCLLRVNQAVAQYRGLGFNDLIGKNYLDIFHIGDRNGMREFYTNAIRSRVPASFEIKDTKEKHEFWVSVAPLSDEAGELVASVGVARDITQMRRMEQALVESETQFRGLAESARDIIFSIDADGSILYLNPALKEILGFNSSDLVGMNIKDILASPGIDPAVQKIVATYLRTPDENKILPLFEIDLKDNKGHKHIMEISARFIGQQYIGVVRDVTARKRMEQQLVRASKLASVGVLAAGLAHQINNPLASILATSSALKEMLANKSEVSETLKEKTGRYVRKMEEQLDRTHRIVSSLLEFTQEKRMDVRHNDANEIIQGALQFITQHLSFKKIDLELALDEKVPPVMVDKDALQEAIVNVIQNAYEAMDGEGKILISTECENPMGLRIEISNSGPPIPPDIREEIFELLFSTKTERKGTGLGLPVAAMLLEHFSGRIYLEESVDNLTTFVIELPTHCKEEE